MLKFSWMCIKWLLATGLLALAIVVFHRWFYMGAVPKGITIAEHLFVGTSCLLMTVPFCYNIWSIVKRKWLRSFSGLVQVGVDVQKGGEIIRSFGNPYLFIAKCMVMVLLFASEPFVAADVQTAVSAWDVISSILILCGMCAWYVLAMFTISLPSALRVLVWICAAFWVGLLALASLLYLMDLDYYLWGLPWEVGAGEPPSSWPDFVWLTYVYVTPMILGVVCFLRRWYYWVSPLMSQYVLMMFGIIVLSVCERFEGCLR